MKRITCFVVALGAVALAQDYPQWRGAARDGSVTFTEPAVWPDTLTRRWRVAVGEGYSTPLLISNTLYTFSRLGDTEALTALDAATGAKRWTTSYPAPFTPSKPAAAHGAGPKATPVFHDGRIFTLGIVECSTSVADRGCLDVHQ